ncbi:hypothetical protein Nocox_25210 [Nonomuraea coxensis DSM 45129]|uniref:GNAT family N-acetyltransferase n=1 Tax=Nonomuraea coxensis DSM 45129 TaxID=1122611 RepID=A0ABX8U4I6_9ACTN|nr:hypothetical protein [Nonomuraea coxensis]QYC42645.1 hypothetical protein Nocox_25210 [Nonomuraea coxensis DSM 45129]
MSVNHDEVLSLYERRFRREPKPEMPGAVVERAGAVVRQSGPAPCWNGVLWSDLDESTADAAIADQIRHYAELGTEFEWKLYGHDRPADLDRRLLAAGFTAEPPETLMVAETARIAVPAAVPAAEPEWRGRGVYRALVAYRARDALARGYRYLQVDASAESRPILARLGFAALATTTPYTHG